MHSGTNVSKFDNQSVYQAPYIGASDTSRDRAHYEDSEGITKSRWVTILDLLLKANTDGHTWSELADLTGLHHGQVSGALSKLHDGEEIVQLHRKRDRSHVYVHAQFVEFLTEPFNRQPVQTRANARVAALEKVAEAAQALCYGQSADMAGRWDALRKALKETEGLK